MLLLLCLVVRVLIMGPTVLLLRLLVVLLLIGEPRLLLLSYLTRLGESGACLLTMLN